MIMPIFALLAVAAAQAASLPAANGDESETMRLHVGETGIRCVRLPCPSRAVFEPDAQGNAVRSRLLYVDLDGRTPPPPMIGDPAHLAAIGEAWKQRQCLAIDGRLISGKEDRPLLRVDRIVGSCREG